MKKCFLFMAVVLMAFSVSAQDLVVGSYNIRNSNSGDARNGNGWERRCPVICDQVEWVGFDVFGLQEVKHNQLEDMLAGLSDYTYEGVGRDDGKQAGEYSPIFYKKERFKYLEGGKAMSFFLVYRNITQCRHRHKLDEEINVTR